MESKAKFAGHPIHQMLIVFPLGLLVMALVFDILYFITGNSGFATAAFWDIPAGIIGGLVAAVFGFIDWLAIPGGTRAKRIGLLHGSGNVVVVLLFAISWLLRWGTPDNAPGLAAFVPALLAVGLGAITGWLGGELVDRLGVGVTPGANLDAPSSLTAPAAGRAGEAPPRQAQT
jgi:uncharacterized membrane protein